MAETLIQTGRFVRARAEVTAAYLTAVLKAVAFTDDATGATITEFFCEDFGNLHVLSLCAVQDCTVDVQVRNHDDDTWVTLDTTALTSGTAAANYTGVLRAARMRIMAKTTAADSGGTVDVSLCLSP